MFLTDDLLRSDTAEARQLWRNPVRRITAVEADVAERFVITARLPAQRFRELVPPTFLAPRPVGGSLMLWLSVLRMRHAVPAWVPLEFGPASVNAALHLACIDVRDGRACPWVGGRYSDSVLAPALSGLGFPDVDGGLADRGGPERLDLSAADGLMRLQAGPGGGTDPELFADAAALAAFIAAPLSLAAGRSSGRFAAVQAEKLADDTLEHCQGWEGWLRTPWGDCTIDGIYRARNGGWRWTSQGEFDGDGHAL